MSPVSETSEKSGAAEPSRTGKRTSKRRAVGIVRVSRVGDREGDSFVSPDDQRQRIAAVCARDAIKVVEVLEELDVSGGTPLARRAGLRRAVEMVEAGEVDTVVVAYFDRLVRSLVVQAEVVDRIEKAGGAILAVDVGEVRADTAGRWLSSTMLGLVAEYARRSTSERTADAKRRAVLRGVPPFPNIPPGYRRRNDGTEHGGPLEPDKHAPAVAEAFRLRAAGSTVMEVRAHLAANGIDRSYHGTAALLASRVVLGELRFGKLVNTTSHTPIVEPHVWRRVQAMSSPRGRRPKSDRLLARAGVLRCGTCGARMVVGTTRQQGKVYGFYRCPPNADCPQRVTISADVAEREVVAEVQRLLAGETGTASAETQITEAEKEHDRLERELEAAVLAFDGLDDVNAVRQRLTALRDDRDRARDVVDDLRDNIAPTITVSADDWPDLTLQERRELVQAVIGRAVVSPGRGLDRIRFEPVGQ